MLIDPDSSFFLNGHGLKLGRIQNTRGSLLEKIGITCGVENLTSTMLRQACEKVIQENSQMQARSKTLNAHSSEVGRQIYDASKPIVRTEFVNFCHIKDKAKDPNRHLLNLNSTKLQEMKETDELDEMKKRRRAEDLLQKDREKRNMSRSLGKRCRVLPNDRYLLQQIVFKNVFQNVYSDFPQGNQSYH